MRPGARVLRGPGAPVTNCRHPQEEERTRVSVKPQVVIANKEARITVPPGPHIEIPRLAIVRIPGRAPPSAASLPQL